MQIRILIDGYNLLFASQLVGRGRGQGWLEKARHRLLTHLRQRLESTELLQTTVVFDANVSASMIERDEATRANLTDSSPTSRPDIRVLYAHAFDEADDLIEKMIREHSAPKNLIVVSGDQRLRRCAQARRATSMDSESFLLWLDQRPIGPAVEPAEGLREEKGESDALSPEEIAEWLREFRED